MDNILEMVQDETNGKSCMAYQWYDLEWGW